MRKLVGNPKPVLQPANGDVSNGYFDDYRTDYEENIDDLKEDVSKIVEAYKYYGCEIEPHVGYYIWKQYSDGLSAHWLMVPDSKEGILDATSRYLVLDVKDDSV